MNRSQQASGPDRRRALETLNAEWNRRGIEASAVADAFETLHASDRRIGTLGIVSTTGATAEDRLFLDPVEIGAALGRGGMGEVLLAEHPALRREVALKRVLQPAERGAADALLKEAWVGAHVEHPNVVPVHALIRTHENGSAALLMQRVSGRSWLEALLPPDAPAAREAYFERQLGVLRRVCNAIAFAHSRGVLHLDLKPDNVMIGAHDEVYVLDWGLAAGFGDASPDWLAPARDISRVAGTPGYMAPELVAADGASIGPWTDVYLLGAVLHQVLTGKTLHRGDSMMEVLASALLSEPPVYEVEVPDELRALVARATLPMPHDRIQDVASFRSSLDDFLDHRPAERIVAGLRRTLDEVACRVPGGPDEDSTVAPVLAGCELALDEIRRGFPTHPDLPSLARRIGEAQLTHVESSEDPRAIRATLERTVHFEDAAIGARREALAARLDSREREIEHLEELSRQLDASLGATDRARTWRMLGLTWLLVCLAYGALERSGAALISYRWLLAQGVVLLALLAPFAFFLRKRLLSNRVARRLSGGLAYCGVAVECLFLGGYLLDVPVRVVLTLTGFCYSYVFLALGIAVDRRLLPGSAIFLGAVGVALLDPRWVHEAIGVAGFVTVLVATAGWMPKAAAAQA